MIKIAIDRIPEEGIRIEEDIPSDLFTDTGLREIFRKPVHINLFIVKNPSHVFISGKISTEAKLSCSRCLTDVAYSLLLSDIFHEKEYSHPDEVIDLTEDIREDIIVGLPIKAICEETCKGICPRCGQNLNEKKCSCKHEEPSSWHMKLDEISKNLKK